MQRRTHASKLIVSGLKLPAQMVQLSFACKDSLCEVWNESLHIKKEYRTLLINNLNPPTAVCECEVAFE